jgi:hypothetical protein
MFKKVRFPIDSYWPVSSLHSTPFHEQQSLFPPSRVHDASLEQAEGSGEADLFITKLCLNCNKADLSFSRQNGCREDIEPVTERRKHMNMNW